MNKLMQVFILILVTFFVVSCSNKQEVSIKPYSSIYAKEASTLYLDLIKINDLRKSKYIAFIKDNNQIVKKFKTNANLINWYADALSKDFSTAGIINSRDAKTTLEINIININAKYIKSTKLKTNLYVDVEMQLVFKTSSNTKTKYIKNSFNSWDIGLSGAEGFESYLYKGLSNSVVNSVKAIYSTL